MHCSHMQWGPIFVIWGPKWKSIIFRTPVAALSWLEKWHLYGHPRAEKLAKVYINPRILSCFEQSFKSVVKFPSSVTEKVQNSNNSEKWGEVELGVGEETNLIYSINVMVSLFNLPRQEFLDCDCYHCETSMVFRVTIAIEWMVWKKPSVPMVFQWFLVYQPLAPMAF